MLYISVKIRENDNFPLMKSMYRLSDGRHIKRDGRHIERDDRHI